MTRAVARGAPPECAPEEYERRFLAQLRRQEAGDDPVFRSVFEDTWLEGHHPDTEVVVVFGFPDRGNRRYVFRTGLWHDGTDSHPETEAGHIDVGLFEWRSTLRPVPLDPGGIYEPRAARANVRPRRPDLEQGKFS
jgi:hypothetical protein